MWTWLCETAETGPPPISAPQRDSSNTPFGLRDNIMGTWVRVSGFSILAKELGSFFGVEIVNAQKKSEEYLFQIFHGRDNDKRMEGMDVAFSEPDYVCP